MSNNPDFVSAVHVDEPYGYKGGSSTYQTAYASEQQELNPNPDRQNPIKQYQDVGWAIAFILHIIVVVALAVTGLGSNQVNHGQHDSPGGLFVTLFITGGSAIGLSCAALSFMMNNSETLVQTALFFSVGCSLLVAVLGFMIGSLLMGIMGLVSFAIGICYARAVWSRIPFAAVNLKTALTAIRQNMGLTAVSMGFTGVAFAWSLLWFLGLGASLSENSLWVVFLLFLSYYWVHQVLQNTMHVTTAGTVATWWFIPDEASSCWSQAITDSLSRSLTFSFGSICFGSFLVALVRALRALEYHTRGNDDYQFLSCIIQCILSCIESIIEYLNRWAYVYVGMYGFSYIEAGKNVIELFQHKGWTVVITDDLADNVLSMISIAIGLASGLVGLLLGYMDPKMFISWGFEQAHGPAFLVGFLAGFLFASVILSVVGSAINTVIVCYAEDPAAFQSNHPQLAHEMREAWIQAWPGINM